MTTIPDLLVDPYLVCLPRYCDREEQLDQFVKNLMSWSDVLQRQDVAVHFPRACLETLLREDYYPYEHEFRRMAASVKADHLSPDLVCKVAQEVLERTPYLEERCEVDFLDFEDDTCNVIPEIYISRLASDIAWGFKHALAVIACFQQATTGAKVFLMVSAKSTPEEAFASQELQIAVRINGIDCSGVIGSLTQQFPLDIVGALPVALHGASLLQSVGCLKLWVQAITTADVRDAINARIEDLLASGTGKRDAVRGFCVGEHFLESATRNGFGARLSVVDSCARILLGEPKNSVEPFRVSEDATEQRTRIDGACALRTHLTKDGPGYRLMLWELTDKSIEFANVGPKNELVIR
jgi:hypothetical protein